MRSFDTTRDLSPSSSSSSCCSRFWSSALRAKRLVTPAEKAARENSTRDLSRRLGLLDLVLIGIGASIGSGIFVITGTVARDTGPGVIISFILAGVSCVINALCYAELASRFPAVVGGAYLYTYTAFNEVTAFLVFGQLMLDYHLGAASIARSLANYVATILELFPVFKDNIPKWIGHGEDIGGVLSINLLAPVLLVSLTLILCRGVGESSALNSFMTVTKVLIVIVVILAGAFEIDVSNWSPFAPNGIKSIFTGATVVFFAYVGFDAVANSAEESKRPQRDLPIGIIGSLVVCIALYIGVCLVITGMVPYEFLGEDAPLAESFTSKGLKYVSVLISIGAVAGLTTTLLVGLYVQSRLYLGLGRDGLLPSIFAKVDSKCHTPIHSQVWVGIIACVLAGLLNVHALSHVLSVGTLVLFYFSSGILVKSIYRIIPMSITSELGVDICMIGCVSIAVVGNNTTCCAYTKIYLSNWLVFVNVSHNFIHLFQTGYSVVSACVIALRWKDKMASQVSSSARQEGVLCLIAVAFCGFGAGLFFRYDASLLFLILAIVVATAASAALCFRQVYADAIGFSCPGVPIVPVICIFLNMFLFAQLHHEAWVRFVFLSAVMVGFYAIYGQYHADPSAQENAIYFRAPDEESELSFQ